MIVADSYLHISIAKQQLSVVSNKDVDKVYSVSTAKNGAGEKMGSQCTPIGWHKIRVKIGDSTPLNSVFVGRRATGEIYSPQLGVEYPERDWVLTRILWLVVWNPEKIDMERLIQRALYLYSWLPR